MTPFPPFLLGLLLTASSESGPVRASLLVDVAHVRPGRPFRAAVRLEMAPGWHTYWKNPGGVGAPTEISWNLPPGWKAGEIQWPAPSRIPSGRLISFGYETEVVFAVEIRPSPEISGETAALGASVEWVACEEICVAGEAALSRELRVAGDEPSPSREAGAIDAAIAQVPIPISARVITDGGRSFLSVEPPPAPTRTYVVAAVFACGALVYFLRRRRTP